VQQHDRHKQQGPASTSPGRLRLTLHRPSAKPPLGSASRDREALEPAELLALASVADQASVAVHNMAAHVDRERTRTEWNRSHRCFLHARCELRRRREASAIETMRAMLCHLDALLVMAREDATWPDHLAAGERTVCALRDALQQAPP
jgi:hypothetical protein